MIPTIPNITMVKMFAQAKGLRFDTYEEYVKAALLYLEKAQLLN